MSRFCRVGLLKDSDDLKFEVLYGECGLYRQLEDIYSRCLAACSRADRGEYGVQAYEAKRCTDRRRNERYEASQAIRRTAHVDARVTSLGALLGEIATELGVTGEVAIEPMIIESAARTGLDGRQHSGSRAPGSWHLDEPIVDLTRGNALLVATTVSNAQGEQVTTLKELVEVMMSNGILTEPLYLSGQPTDITTQRSHPRLKALATVSTVMESIVTVQAAVGNEWLGLEPEEEEEKAGLVGV
jgi:hypothetical protein